MAHDHTFDCKICGAHLDSQRDLDGHTSDKHPGRVSANPSGNRASESDSAIRDRKKINDLERL
jgi:hypothetical protein